MISDAAHILYLEQRLRELEVDLLKARQEAAHLRAALQRHPHASPTHIGELLAPLAAARRD